MPEGDKLPDRDLQSEIEHVDRFQLSQYAFYGVLNAAGGFVNAIGTLGQIVQAARARKLRDSGRIDVDRKQKWPNLIVQVARDLCPLFFLNFHDLTLKDFVLLLILR